MRRFQCALLATIAAVVFTSIASAADMPVKAPIVKAPAAAPFSWTGCYVGAQAGYKFGSTTPYNPVTRTNWSNSIDYNGFIGGGTLGCNYQVSTWVFGVEGDYSWASVKGLSSDLLAPLAFNVQLQERSFGTARGRVGYAWNSNFLLYVTGGGAWSNVKFSFPCVAGLVGCNDFVSTKTVSGYAVGAGMEYAFNRNWSVKGEWLYVDYGTPQFIATSVFNGAPTSPANVRMKQNLVRAGFNYKFYPF